MCRGVVKKFRDGIFSLRTRRLGVVAEIMIKKMYGFVAPLNKYHDMFDAATKQRIEVKFSTATKQNEVAIREDNVILQCVEANELSNRVISSNDVVQKKFDCNIQQVKPEEFDILYYGLFFSDCVYIYRIASSDVSNISGWSDKQHKNNLGEGQFHIKNETFEFHQQYFTKKLSYKELYDILK